METADSVALLEVAVTEIEDRSAWDAAVLLDAAVDAERRADALGARELRARARLCQANMWMRQGDVTAAAGRVLEVREWAVDHHARMVEARAHLVWANVQRFLGDPAACLEYSVRAVELLDDTATPHTRVWHRTKLADALGFAGSMDAARTRYAQAEQMAGAYGLDRLSMTVLNNFAYTELSSGSRERAQLVAVRLQEFAAARGLELNPAHLDTIGSIEISNGRYAAAQETMHRCIARHAEGHHEDADALAAYLLTLAAAQRGGGATDRSQASLDASRRLCVERGLGEVLVRVHQEQAELHAARGDYAAAFATHKIFHGAHHRLHSSRREAQARTRQAMFETYEARQEAERFREQARRDPLTGLRNRRYVSEQLPVLIDTAASLTLAIVDLDHFKRVNDHLSHEVGDQVLVMVAKLLETELTAFSADGFTARLGGEEFLLVLPDIDPADAAVHLERVRGAIRSYAWADVTRGLPVTVSIGAAGTGDLAEPSQAGLLSLADRHLYVAKHAGRDRVVMASAGPRRSIAALPTPRPSGDEDGYALRNQ